MFLIRPYRRECFYMDLIDMSKLRDVKTPRRAMPDLCRVVPSLTARHPTSIPYLLVKCVVSFSSAFFQYCRSQTHLKKPVSVAW